MRPITEEQIDEVTSQLSESETAYLQCLEDLENKHPILFPYLLSEDFEVLKPEERDYLFFLLAVVWKAIRDELPAGAYITEEQLGGAEEQNWTVLQESKAKTFRDRLDPFFEQYPQEDLLAFVEDALSDNEEGILSKEAREPIFVTLKSIIDCWIDITSRLKKQ